MNGAFMVWDDLLCKLVRHQRRFLRIFVTRMVHLMIQQPRMNVKQDPFREALCLWALHIFVDESWADARKRIEDSLRTKVVSICIMNPVYWGQRLARLLIEAADETFQYDWIPLYNECLPQSASSSQQDSVAPVTRGSATQRGLKRLDEVMFTPMKRPVVSSSAQRTRSSGAQLTSLRTPSNPAHPEESSQPWSLCNGGWRPVSIGLSPSWAERLD
ncbi:rRNA-processing protein las1 [Cryomyces antarcticus]|uniref:rRNA-processing protein las1 n=1 Tax=Cryomyces antarcticus TaxID=329879 RepID=A0ABR0M5H1_9PEZI|nr:rRNA-processing protein las1 [Cryomyces antarcticus]